MRDLVESAHLDPRAFSPFLRGVSVVLSTLLVGGVILTAFATAAGILA